MRMWTYGFEESEDEREKSLRKKTSEATVFATDEYIVLRRC